jgi:23S rRNA (cytidine1920-2'-O)/16S rRNA (cytidine1409-2'-O)-methyltransferase
VSTKRIRLDVALVERGLCASRNVAQSAISSGLVVVNGSIALSASRQVAGSDQLSVSGEARQFVSRGGEKLVAALEAFSLDVTGLVALDAGASTGGFTDCLLQRGATKVFAVDVGYGQLDHKLRQDDRVVVRERTNVRYLTAEELHEPGAPFAGVDLIVADVSFISLTKLAQVFGALLKTQGRFAVLVKPQFEASRAEVSDGKGVVRDPEVWRRAIEGVAAAFAPEGLIAESIIVSPIHGPKGNTEFVFVGSKAESSPEQLEQFSTSLEEALRHARAMQL